MAIVNFYLKEPKSDKKTSIMVMLSADGNRYKLYTGLMVHKNEWEPDRCRVKKNNTGSVEMNAKLKDIDKKLPKVYLAITNDNPDLSYSQIQELLKSSIQEDKPKKQLDLQKIYEEFMQEKALQVKPLTMKKYNTLLKLLHNYSQKKGKKLEFQTIDEKFDISFRNYLIQDLNQSNDTISKYYDCLKVFLSWASKQGFNKNKAYVDFEAKRSKGDIIYLTESELLKIYTLNLSSNLRLSRIRDLFCFLCFTGQRFSDICQIKWTDIKDCDHGKEWHLYQVKGNKTRKIIVPLSVYACEILNRNPKVENKQLIFSPISNQKANEYIKEVAQLAQIDEPTTTVKYSGKIRIEKTEPKHNFISTHTGRRTFVTLSLEKGMRPEIVQEITGHEDYRTMKKYIKIINKVTTVEFHKVWDLTHLTKIS